jgi:hypothetical protein
MQVAVHQRVQMEGSEDTVEAETPRNVGMLPGGKRGIDGRPSQISLSSLSLSSWLPVVRRSTLILLQLPPVSSIRCR